uniref:Uncharacterized protein n=1 Tax=Glossina austeni TaxID=7395 RepID=A0A1A9ULU1_GLOAU
MILLKDKQSKYKVIKVNYGLEIFLTTDKLFTMCSCKNIWKHLLEYFVIFEFCISQSMAILPRCAEYHDHNPMHYVCTGLYPRILRIFYADSMVSTGLTYSVFRSISRPHHYLIAHGRSEVSKCRGFLEAYDDHQFRCNERSCIVRSMALDEQCNQFFDGANKLNRLCAAYYPSFGTSSATGDEYVVYQLDGKKSRYFITLGMSAITSCKGTIYMESDSEYHCDGVTLQLPPGKLPKLYCLTFPFVFSQILVAHCTRNDSINPQQTAILYPDTRKFQSFSMEK